MKDILRLMICQLFRLAEFALGIVAEILFGGSSLSRIAEKIAAESLAAMI